MKSLWRKLAREFWWVMCSWDWGQWLYWRFGWKTVPGEEPDNERAR